MSPLFVAGFDAGQTTCRCRLLRWEPTNPSDGLDEPTLGDGEGSGVSHLDAEHGESRFIAAINSSLTAARAAAGLPSTAAPLAAVIGASGLEQGTALQGRAQALMAAALGLPAEHCLATGDERTALHGAFPNRPGIVLISGTGMIAVGRDDQGVEARSGGWGWMLDGGGSAFDLGHQGLQLTLRMADGRMADAPLRHRLWDALGCNSAAEIKALVVRPERSVAALAQLAPLVVEAAGHGDHDARRIVQHSAQALAEAVTAVATTLALSAPAISPRGGVLSHLPLMRDLVEDALGERLPGWHWQQGGGDACTGALALAKGLLRPR